MYYERSRSEIKGQGHSVKTSCDRQIIGQSMEIGGPLIQWYVRILIGSSQLAFCAHEQYIFGQKQPSSTGRLQVAVHCHAFQFFIAVNSKCIYYTSHVRTILICHIFAPMQTSEVFSNIHKRRLFVSALVVCVRII